MPQGQTTCWALHPTTSGWWCCSYQIQELGYHRPQQWSKHTEVLENCGFTFWPHSDKGCFWQAGKWRATHSTWRTQWVLTKRDCILSCASARAVVWDWRWRQDRELVIDDFIPFWSVSVSEFFRCGCHALFMYLCMFMLVMYMLMDSIFRKSFVVRDEETSHSSDSYVRKLQN